MSVLDLLVIGVYGVAVVGLGILTSRGSRTRSEWALARRRLPTWAVLASMVATELSAATFLGVPHAAYLGDWSYLQLAFGAFLGKALLAWHVIPLYHRLGVVTVYGFLEGRFGPRSRRAAALCFIGGRILASGARLFIAALAFAAATEVPVEVAIVACGLLAGIYTVFGGIRAVVWTDALQALVFLGAAGALVAVLVAQAPGGLSEIWSWAQAEQRSRIFHFSPLLALGDARPFLVGVFGGFFLTLATHATDHDMVQRLLTTRDGRGGSRALLGSALLNFPFTLLFLFIGSGLAYAYLSPPPYGTPDPAHALATFALRELPIGLRGLLFAGLLAAAMSSLDSALCAIATTWAVDVRPARTERSSTGLEIASAIFCGALVLAALGVAAYHRGLASSHTNGLSLVELALAAMTILYGGLLGVFGVGFVTRRRGSDASACRGLAGGALTGLALFLHPLVLERTVVAWPWWIPIGAMVAAGLTLRGGSDGDRGRQEGPRVHAAGCPEKAGDVEAASGS